MQIRYMILFSTVVITVAASALWQQDLSKAEINTEKVTENIYMLSGPGGNITVLTGEDGVVMIDDQMAPLSDKILAAIKAIGGDAPKFIINTHHHPDHAGANGAFSEHGTIIAHENVRHWLSTSYEAVYAPAGTEPLPESYWPVITFDESLTLHLNDEEIEAVHVPDTHTNGDAVIYFKKANVVTMGDIFFSGTLPFIDLDTGGKVENYLIVIDRFIKELPDDVRIIPGHGPLSGKAELEIFLAMLQETVTTVRDQMAQGEDVEEIVARGLPDKWASWENPFVNREKWIRTIHRSYSN